MALQLNDEQLASFEALTGIDPGQLNDVTVAYLKSVSGSDSNDPQDLWYATLVGLGYTGAVQDMQVAYWTDILGHGGQWNDLYYEWLVTTGGAFGPNVAIVLASGGSCDYQPPTTTDCTAIGTYTANDTGFTNPADTWLWTIEPPVVGVDLTDATLKTCTVTTPTSDTDLTFNLKVVATDSVSTDTANRTTEFTQDHDDTNVAPVYIGPNIAQQFVAQGIPINPIETFLLFTGTNLAFSLEGAWPAALVIDAGTGQITGTATDPITDYPNLTVRATNSKGFADTDPFTVTVTAGAVAPVFVGPVPAQVWQEGVAIAQFPMATYFTGTLPITYIIESGAFPVGITMNTAGQINGTPTVDGTGSVQIRATNGSGFDVTNVWGWTIWEAIVSSTIPAQSTQVNAPYSHDFSQYFTGTVSTYGINPPSWPAGLTIDPNTGIVTGTPTSLFTGSAARVHANSLYEPTVLSNSFIFDVISSLIYYVSDIDGDDNDSGLTEALAWKTVAKVNAGTFFAGDTILFNKGDEWRETLTVPDSGSAISPITFGAYGTGADPIINGSDLVATWTPGGETNTWQAALTTSPNQVFMDGTRGTKQASEVACVAEFDWFWAASVLYIFSTTDPDTAYTTPGVEASTRIRCIYMGGRNYITVQDMHFKYAGLDNVGIDEGSDNVIVDGVTSEYAYWRGVQISTAAGSCDNTILRNSTVTYSGGNGVWIGTNTNNTLIQSNIFHHNCQLAIDGSQHIFTAGIKANGSSAVGLIVEFNEVYLDGDGQTADRGGGIWTDIEVPAPIFRYNKSYDNQYKGIYIELTSNAQCYYNLVWGINGSGIDIRGDSSVPTSSAEDNHVYNNVIYNCVTGIQVWGTDGFANSCMNNLIRNNISTGNSNAELTAFWGGENAGTEGSGNVYEYNCLGVEAPAFVKWGWVGGDRNTYDAWEASYGGTTNSVEADPLFTDAPNDDFTLQATSLCIDAGVDVGLIRDFIDTLVPQGTFPDVGAYEFVGSPAPVPAFYALTPDETTFEMLGVSIGTGGLTTTHTADLYAADYIGIYKQYFANDAVWSGGRKVTNFVSDSIDLSTAFITNTTLSFGIADPDGGNTAASALGGAGGNRYVYFSHAWPSATNSVKDINSSIWLRRRTGTGTVELFTPQNSAGPNITAQLADTLWHRFSISGVSAGGANLNADCRFRYAEGDEIDFWHPQIEDVSGNTDVDIPGEYLATDGTFPTAGPLPGAWAVFANANGNTVLANVVTEAVGAPLAEIPYLQYYPAAQNETFQSNNIVGTTTGGSVGAWGWGGASVRTYDEIGLTGEPNTATYVETSGSGGFGRQNFNIAADTSWHTAVYWVKKTVGAATFPGVGLQETIGNVLVSQYTVNTDNGTLTDRQFNTGTIASEVVDAGDWWKVFSSVQNGGATTVITHNIWGAVTSGVDTGTWDYPTGNTVIGNVEFYDGKTIAEVRGLGPIFTTTAAVATDAPLYLVDLVNHVQDNGAYYVDWVPSRTASISGSTNRSVFTIRNSDLGMAYFRGSGSFRSYDGAVFSESTIASWDQDTQTKLAFVYDTTDDSLVTNYNGVYGNQVTYDGAFVITSTFRLFQVNTVDNFATQMRELQRFDITSFQNGKDIIDGLMAEVLVAEDDSELTTETNDSLTKG